MSTIALKHFESKVNETIIRFRTTWGFEKQYIFHDGWTSIQRILENKTEEPVMKDYEDSRLISLDIQKFFR